VICQLFRKWLDDLEHFCRFAFVMGKHNALRKDIGNDKKPFGRHVPQLNRSSRLNLVLGFTGERNDRSFFLKTHELATDPGLQRFQKVDFSFGRKANQHRDAVAKQNSDTGLANLDRERERRKHFSLEARRIDPISNVQGMCGDPCTRFRRDNCRFGHHDISPSLRASCSFSAYREEP
jgi:hypothetical protein